MVVGSEILCNHCDPVIRSFELVWVNWWPAGFPSELVYFEFFLIFKVQYEFFEVWNLQVMNYLEIFLPFFSYQLMLVVNFCFEGHIWIQNLFFFLPLLLNQPINLIYLFFNLVHVVWQVYNVKISLFCCTKMKQNDERNYNEVNIAHEKKVKMLNFDVIVWLCCSTR